MGLICYLQRLCVYRSTSHSLQDSLRTYKKQKKLMVFEGSMMACQRRLFAPCSRSCSSHLLPDEWPQSRSTPRSNPPASGSFPVGTEGPRGTNCAVFCLEGQQVLGSAVIFGPRHVEIPCGCKSRAFMKASFGISYLFSLWVCPNPCNIL